MKTYEKGAAEEFGRRLSKALEDKNGGNQSEMARVVGCSPQAANKWVAGIQFPRDKMLRKVAEYVGVTPEYLRFGKTVESATPPAPKFILEYVDLDEAELLSLYRELSEAGKRQFRVAAQSAEKLPAEALPKRRQRA